MLWNASINPSDIRRACVVTTSRADYSLLYEVMVALRAADDFALQVVACGSHLSTEHGLTYKEIEADGFPLSFKIEMLLASDSAVGIGTSMGIGTIGASHMLDKLHPDIVLLHGDRFELLAIASACMTARIPISHFSGGDITEGSYDDCARHALTKLSHLHFTTNPEAAHRVRQMGENPDHIVTIGELSLIEVLKCRDRGVQQRRKEIAHSIPQLSLEIGRTVMIIFHPPTLSRFGPIDQQYRQLLTGLDMFLEDEDSTIFVLPNADNDRHCIQKMIENWIKRRNEENTRAWTFSSLPRTLFLNLLAECDVLVGNSSCGLTERPSLRKATVNVGDRQAGRYRPNSVIDVDVEAAAIRNACTRAVEMGDIDTENKYTEILDVDAVLETLRSIPCWKDLLHKQWYYMSADGDILPSNLF